MKNGTPDAMTLIVVGNIDARSVAEQINKTFGTLKGKRETPAGADAFAAAGGISEHYDRCGAPGSSLHYVGYAVATDSRIGGAVALLAGGSGARSAVLAYPARAD